ncbi:hypothetical protein UlMin_007798 [Ulmus minor]
MAATIGPMAMHSFKCFTINSSKNLEKNRLYIKPPSLLSLKGLPRSFKTFESSDKPNFPTLPAKEALAGAVLFALSSSNPALAAQQIADLSEGDNRGLALLLPLVPAILWVLYNILGPALNQINRMRSDKGIIVGLGLGGLAGSGFFTEPYASASEIVAISEASSDNRGLLLLFVIAPALVWVLYNILPPALNQINRMQSK